MMFKIKALYRVEIVLYASRIIIRDLLFTRSPVGGISSMTRCLPDGHQAISSPH